MCVCVYATARTRVASLHGYACFPRGRINQGRDLYLLAVLINQFAIRRTSVDNSTVVAAWFNRGAVEILLGRLCVWPEPEVILSFEGRRRQRQRPLLVYRYFNVSPCYAMEDAQPRDIRGRAEARVTAFRRARNPFSLSLSLSLSGGIKFFHSMYFRSLKGWIDFSRLLLLYTLEGVDYYFIYYYIRRNDYYTILLLSRSCLDILNMQCVVLLIAVIF